MPAADGKLYMLRPFNQQGQITRLDPATGKVAAGWGTKEYGQIYFDGGAGLRGLTELNGTLFTADTAAGVIRFGSTANPIPFAGQITTVASPRYVDADRKTDLLWVLSGAEKLVAVKPDGTVVATATPLPDIAAFSVRDGVLAAISRTTGKVHLFDVTDPKNPKPTRIIGRGDGPFGYYLPDRFTFQRAPTFAGNIADVALGPDGLVGVLDGNRILAFDAEGKCLWSTYGSATNAIPSLADPRRQYFQNSTYLVDGKTGTWQPEGLWDMPGFNGDSEKLLGDFQAGKKTFIVFTRKVGVVIYERLDDGSAKLVSTIAQGSAPNVPDRLSMLNPNGDILAFSQPDTWVTVWHFGGLDADGKPIYRPQDCTRIPKVPFTSPFTYESDNQSSAMLGHLTKDGGVIANMWTKSSLYGTGWSNTAGTDLARFDANGKVRWFHPLGEYQGTPGFVQLGPVSVVGCCTYPQLIAVDPNGLGLGSTGLPAAANWEGFWIDYEGALQGYTAKDGRYYAVIGDNIKGCGQWFRLNGVEKIVNTRTPLTVSTALAAQLQAISASKPVKLSFRPATPQLRIPRLKEALPIDGDLEKWRKAGVVPQIIITPEASAGGIKGPQDASAIIRMAYQGNDLYVQILRFDDVVTFHQPSAKSYMQDNVEMCINGFMDGFKYMLSPTSDKGLFMPRQRFMGGKYAEGEVSADHAPRVVKVLDDAKSVSERELIESVYGVDMSTSKVIVTEFKLPIDEESYGGDKNALFPMKPGQTFWLGFMIDDNDESGADIQKFCLWPATYGTFQPKEDGALAELE